MSGLNLGKKLIHARKAWKSLTVTVKKKLRKLNKSKPITTTTKRLHTLLHRSRSRSLAPNSCRCYKYKKRSSSALRSHRHDRHQYAPVYIDELFMDTTIKFQVKQPVISQAIRSEMEDHSKAKASAAIVDRHNQLGGFAITRAENEMEVTKKMSDHQTSAALLSKKATSSGPSTSSSSWLMKLHGVDERAEEFITKFREEMRLQREESYGEFQEMLARGL